MIEKLIENAAPFVRLDANNIVEDIIALHKSNAENGQQFISEALGLQGDWIADENPLSKNKKAALGKEYLPEFRQFRTLAEDAPEGFTYNAEVGSWMPDLEVPADADVLIGFSDEVFGSSAADNAKKYLYSPSENRWMAESEAQENSLKDVLNKLALPSFIENEEGFLVPPIPYPTDGKFYIWDEPTISWVETEEPLPPHLIAE